ncbi:hypothetical protein [Aerosakkonema funiforme]|uniref:hypothetical protein n=1 Tax=Aerosakkonema funiforme TaxID=1246630 RepID=UPI0035BA3F5B
MAVRRKRPTFKLTENAKFLASQARIRLGWKLEDPTPLKLASQYLYPNQTWPIETQTRCLYAPGISQATWKRFLYGMGRISKDVFEAFCKILGLDWQQVAELENIAHTNQFSFKEKEPLPPVYFIKEIHKINEITKNHNNEIIPILKSFLPSNPYTLPSLHTPVSLNIYQQSELSFSNSISINIKWLMSLIDKARNLYQANQTNNQETAIEILKSVRNSINFPPTSDEYSLWLVVHYELGVAYKNRIQGDSIENLRLAYNAFEKVMVYQIQQISNP